LNFILKKSLAKSLAKTFVFRVPFKDEKPALAGKSPYPLDAGSANYRNFPNSRKFNFTGARIRFYHIVREGEAIRSQKNAQADFCDFLDYFFRGACRGVNHGPFIRNIPEFLRFFSSRQSTIYFPSPASPAL